MRINYSKYTGEDLGISAEDLMRALSDFFLQSGYERQYRFGEMDPQALENLKRAIEEALLNGDQWDQQMQEQMQGMTGEQFEKLVDNLIQTLSEAGYINVDKPGDGESQEPGEARFDMTGKSVDFLGFKTLKDLMGSLGRASFGAHDTRELATGVETSGSAKPYEYRRHDEPGRQLYAIFRAPAGGRGAAPEPGIFRLACTSSGVPKQLRHGRNARLQPQYDSLRRGPIHACKKGGTGIGSPDSHPIPG